MIPAGEREHGVNRCCRAEEIFELCEGSLEPERGRVVRRHVQSCSECRRLYEREMSLNAALSGVGSGVPDGSHDAAGRIAMTLPTRSVLARVVWGVGAVALLAMALVSLVLHSAQPITFVTDLVATCWGLTSGVSDATGILLAVSGSTLLVALVVGALVDALIAATLLAVARWWRPRGA